MWFVLIRMFFFIKNSDAKLDPDCKPYFEILTFLIA
jgi:hypothetical protein